MRCKHLVFKTRFRISLAAGRGGRGSNILFIRVDFNSFDAMIDGECIVLIVRASRSVYSLSFSVCLYTISNLQWMNLMECWIMVAITKVFRVYINVFNDYWFGRFDDDDYVGNWWFSDASARLIDSPPNHTMRRTVHDGERDIFNDSRVFNLFALNLSKVRVNVYIREWLLLLFIVAAFVYLFRLDARALWGMCGVFIIY